MLLGSVSVDCRLHGTGQHRIWPRSLKSFELFVFSLLQVAAIKKVTVTTSHIPRHFKYLFTGHPKALQCALQGPQILCAHCVCNNQSTNSQKIQVSTWVNDAPRMAPPVWKSKTTVLRRMIKLLRERRRTSQPGTGSPKSKYLPSYPRDSDHKQRLEVFFWWSTRPRTIQGSLSILLKSVLDKWHEQLRRLPARMW